MEQQALTSQRGDHHAPWEREMEQALSCLGGPWVEMRERLSSQILAGRPIVLPPPSVHAAAASASPGLLAQGSHDDTASSPLALVPVGMDNHPSEAFGYELPDLAMYSPFGRPPSGGHHRILNQGYSTYTTTGHDGNNTGQNRLNFLRGLAAAPPHVFTRSSGEHGRNSDGDILLDYDLEAVRRFYYDLAGGQAHRAAHLLGADYDMEAGGHAHRADHLLAAAAAADGARRRGGDAAAPGQEPPEAANLLEGVMVQAFAAFLPACVTAYPLLKDAPDYVKFTIFGGLASITVGLFAGILSRSVARRGLAIRLVSFSAIAVLTFSVASQLSSRTYIAVTALVGVALNLIIMLLRF